MTLNTVFETRVFILDIDTRFFVILLTWKFEAMVLFSQRNSLTQIFKVTKTFEF